MTAAIKYDINFSNFLILKSLHNLFQKQERQKPLLKISFFQSYDLIDIITEQ